MKQHTVAEGQRWDYISYLYYNTSDNYEEIKNANIYQLSFDEYSYLYAPTGKTLLIPDLPTNVQNEIEDQLGKPPWEQ